MRCPNCKKVSLCGCKSCKGRRKGTMPLQRTEKLSRKLDGLKCPYCKAEYHLGYLEDLDYKQYQMGEAVKMTKDQLVEFIRNLYKVDTVEKCIYIPYTDTEKLHPYLIVLRDEHKFRIQSEIV